MPSLLERISGLAETMPSEDLPRIARDYFMAGLYELSQGRVTKAQLVQYWELTAEQQTSFDWVIDKYNAQPDAAAKAVMLESLSWWLALAELGAPGYNTTAELQALINGL
jgi:hypothetical protein